MRTRPVQVPERIHYAAKIDGPVGERTLAALPP